MQLHLQLLINASIYMADQEIKLSLYLTKHHAMETYGGMAV
jgi:hypothetical protein